ncbi:DUF4365 domain-containing protein [Pseudomonas yamanorum]|uniref:DUF4365 domain-containing protein n=1 Tax=Pseudomonas yamanorum TaxID=515393 RepID=UPI00087994CA|nr:DUF4365 domain-containing protein [Pseudomonas yamanorum]SDU32567.1 protein of unknown function [Pseudomonas yamanorum]
MTSESNRISAASTAYTDSVCRAWGWSWQEMGQVDDDGVDGLIYLRTMKVDEDRPEDRRSWKHLFTGGLIHVQIKSGASYVARREEDFIEIKIPNIETKRELWKKSPLPVALLYVKEVGGLWKIPSQAWWADLKLTESYTDRGTVIVQLKNRFQPGIECLRPFSRLATGQHRALGLAEVDMSRQGNLPNRLNLFSKSLKPAAWDFYQIWKAEGASHPTLGTVTINRTGWSHITRVGRPLSRIQASFELLPVAARIIEAVDTWHKLRQGLKTRQFTDGSWAQYDYLGVSAMVKWPAREASEVIVILKRETTLIEDSSVEGSERKDRIRIVGTKTWFYSVYEPGRRKGKI